MLYIKCLNVEKGALFHGLNLAINPGYTKNPDSSGLVHLYASKFPVPYHLYAPPPLIPCITEKKHHPLQYLLSGKGQRKDHVT